MDARVVVTLCQLMPFLYAGMYMLAHPSSSIRVVNKVLADTHRLESNMVGELFAEPKPIADSRNSRWCLRAVGLAMLVAGLFRLYSL
jgi:hypothetical protein